LGINAIVNFLVWVEGEASLGAVLLQPARPPISAINRQNRRGRFILKVIKVDELGGQGGRPTAEVTISQKGPTI
jgi:hypothetical protein